MHPFISHSTSISNISTSSSASKVSFDQQKNMFLSQKRKELRFSFVAIVSNSQSNCHKEFEICKAVRLLSIPKTLCINQSDLLRTNWKHDNDCSKHEICSDFFMEMSQNVHQPQLFYIPLISLKKID